MAAYWVSRVHVTDSERYDKYTALAGGAVEKNGGTILARGGKQIVLEGDNFERTVVARFETLEQAEACYYSPEYAAARQFAVGAAVRHMVVVEAIE
jgi:uncharacterized protein (DUF1330 family)